MSEFEIERIKELSEETGIQKEEIEDWYKILQVYPIFNVEQGLDCLEIICERRMAYYEELERVRIEEEQFGRNDLFKPYSSKLYVNSVDYTINYALNNIYAEEALPYLSDEFIKMNKGKIYRR